MTTEHEGVSPASAGGAAAPDLAALAAAALPALDAARKAFEAAAAPLPPFKRRPVLAGPALNMTGDEDGNTWPEGVGWALSWGCQLTFGRDEKTAVPYVQVSLSDEDRRRGITQRTATRAQVAEFARMLAEQFGEPAGPDPRNAEIKLVSERNTGFGNVYAEIAKALGDDTGALVQPRTYNELVGQMRRALDVLDVEVKQHNQTKAERNAAATALVAIQQTLTAADKKLTGMFSEGATPKDGA